MVFILAFGSNATFHVFFFVFLVMDLHFLILAVSTQIFNPTAELAEALGVPTEETGAEIETHPVIAEAKISKCLKQFTSSQLFCASYSLNCLGLFLQ